MSRLRALFGFQESGLVLVVLVIGAVLTIFSEPVRRPKFEILPDGTRQRVFTTDASGERVPAFEEKNKFLNAENLTQLAKDTSFVAIMAVGMTMVIIAGGIDLSVGAIYALASVLGATLLNRYGPDGAAAGALGDGSVLAALAACVAVGVACGLANGGLTVALGVHPFIITLGSMAILRGIAFVATDGLSIGRFPPELQNLVLRPIAGLSLVPLFAMAVVTAVGWVYLARLAAGRRVYAVGGNETAAHFSGIKVNRVKLGVFVFSGLTAGFAAVLNIGYYGAASSGDGQGYELNVIAAAVVGGASLSGGKGTALGAVLGALIIQMITSGIVILGMEQKYSQIITGSVVIAAVVFDKFNSWLSRRRLLGAAAKP
ncbi:MAG TPA: ABC transporter permease [Opitutaceae bacterium]|nr:ABC transporter permease [Opitutaceae bacterium]